jgi:two-component system LytT family response regulator
MVSIQAAENQTIYKASSLYKVAKKVIVSNTAGHHFIDPNTILYLKSDGNYCNIYLVDGTRILCARTLKSIYNELDENQFIRSHNSIVINWKMVLHINASLSEIKLEGGIIVPIARARKKELKLLIS